MLSWLMSVFCFQFHKLVQFGFWKDLMFRLVLLIYRNDGPWWSLWTLNLKGTILLFLLQQLSLLLVRFLLSLLLIYIHSPFREDLVLKFYFLNWMQLKLVMMLRCMCIGWFAEVIEKEEEDFEQLARSLENASPLEIMDKALEKFGNDIAIAFR